jgi:acyl-CoA thioesterase-1
MMSRSSRFPTYIHGFWATVLCFVLAACANDAKSPATTAPEQAPDTTAVAADTRGNIVFFGNSLTAGYGLDEEHGFPSLIQRRLDSLGLDYQAVNAGLSGETSAGGLTRIDWVMRQPIAVFVLELGGNDALRGFDLQTTRTNLQGIIDKVKAKYPAAKIVIAGMEAPPNLGKAYTDGFRQIYIDLAQQNQAARIPFLLENVGGIPELNLPDRIHPNQEGQVIVANNVWRVLERVL